LTTATPAAAAGRVPAAHPVKTMDALRAEMDLFRIRRYAVLVDRSVDPAVVGPLVGDGLAGFFTFTLDVAGEVLHGRTVDLLSRGTAPPECDGWILGSRSKACYALNQLLLETGRERQTILTLATHPFVSIFSYVDFFKGETQTQACVHNVFERAYKIPFPIALRYVVRSQTGEPILASQKILAPAHTVVFDSAELDVPEPFAGYLELYADVRPLDGDVSAFLHLNCDYISADAMTTVHQSGYAPWPAGSRFGRGLMPVEPERRLTVSLYNRVNVEPICPTAELRCTLDGRRTSFVRDLPPVPQGHMVFADLTALFAPELAGGATAADVVIVPDRPMHRPNFYVHRKDRTVSWQSVEHSDGRGEGILREERRQFLRRAGLHPWVCPLPVLPDAQELDTIVHYLHEGSAHLHRFRLRAYDIGGRSVSDTEVDFDFGATLNVSEWVRANAGAACSLVTLVPGDRAPEVPDSYQMLGAFQSRRCPSPPASQLAGVSASNLPVDVEQAPHWRLPIQHAMLPLVSTEIFGKARVGPDFDTTVVLHNASAFDRHRRDAQVELDVVTWDGRSTRFYRTIPANASMTFSVSDLLAGANIRSERDHYTLWAYCRDCFIMGYHIVRRRRDDALGVEHFYYPRFASREQ
jgi:hypothetical protein